MAKRPVKKKQADHQQLARKVLDAVAPDAEAKQDTTGDGKNAAAVALGRLGGKKGGPARAKKLSKARRSEIAQKAAQTRWKRRKSK
jgi:hypothetical protein